MACVLLKCVFYCLVLNSPFVLRLQFAAVLDGVLSKLSRYDEGTFFSSILSFTVSGVFFFLFLCSISVPKAEIVLYKDSIVYAYPLLKVKAAAKYVDVPVSVTQLRTLCLLTA